MTISPSLTVVLVNYNTTPEVGSIIQSFAESEPAGGTEVRFVVIDNKSTKLPVSSLTIPPSWATRVTVIKNQQNVGYAPAITGILQLLGGDYLLFLNPDVIPGDWGWLFDLVRFISNHEEVGVVGPVLYDAKGGMFCGGSYNPWFPTVSLGGKSLKQDEMSHLASGKIPLPYLWISGAALLTRTELFKRLNGFDSNLFFYYDEIDYCIRVWMAGYRVICIPWARLGNIGGLSIRRTDPTHRLESYLTNYWGVRGVLYLDKKFLSTREYGYYVVSHIVAKVVAGPLYYSLKYKSANPLRFALEALRDSVRERKKTQLFSNTIRLVTLIRKIDSERAALMRAASE